MSPVAGHMRRYVSDLRMEASGPGRDAVAIGVGIFIGCLPFFGLHLLLCIAAGLLLNLNRLKLYLAANISNPFMAPFLLLAELQVGSLISRGVLRPLTVDAVRSMDLWAVAGELLAGSLLVGGVLGLSIGGATWLLTRGESPDPWFALLVRRAANRYIPHSLTAWEFARGKLSADPLYRMLVGDGYLESGATLVDVGCGTGVTLSLLVEADAAWRAGEWPAGVPAPPLFERLTGIEIRPRVSRLARSALGASAAILDGDARSLLPARCETVLVFDVLHMMPPADQVALLQAMRLRLDGGGRVLVREADAGAGWRFRAVRTGNQIKAIAFGNWRQRFHYRTAEEWSVLFAELGFDARRRGASVGTPFGNVLFTLSAAIQASPS